MRLFFFFFFNDTATTEIYTLSLHDALPISRYTNIQISYSDLDGKQHAHDATSSWAALLQHECDRSEEHTSELQSLTNLVCRLLLEKKKKARGCTAYAHNASQDAKLCGMLSV